MFCSLTVSLYFTSSVPGLASVAICVSFSLVVIHSSGHSRLFTKLSSLLFHCTNFVAVISPSLLYHWFFVVVTVALPPSLRSHSSIGIPSSLFTCQHSFVSILSILLINRHIFVAILSSFFLCRRLILTWIFVHFFVTTPSLHFLSRDALVSFPSSSFLGFKFSSLLPRYHIFIAFSWSSFFVANSLQCFSLLYNCLSFFFGICLWQYFSSHLFDGVSFVAALSPSLL